LRNTIFESPFFTSLLRPFSSKVLCWVGWSVTGTFDHVPKAVVIGAPHTSNWDLILGLIVALKVGFPMHWMGKQSIFIGPFNLFFRWFGGIPVDRSRSTNMVSASILELKEAKSRYLVIAPEGTRSYRKEWKSGFYHIAHGAGVPLVLAFLDYENKKAGFGPTITTTGDFDADMKEIYAFYDAIKGRHPEKARSPSSSK
jgi:1-acyl-sn-glycerol-3-phosphate acyltransferase